MNILPLKERNISDKNLFILIFVEGTITRPRRWLDFLFPEKYIPVKNSVAKIEKWRSQGAKIGYLTSRKSQESVHAIKEQLLRFGFEGDFLYSRSKGETYKNVVEALCPDILIEDDCKSIGGACQTAIRWVDKTLKSKIHSIIVKEFCGIEHLPDSLSFLNVQ
jgi:hypothetical protein